MKTIRQFVVLVVLLLVAGRASAQYSESEYNPTVFMVLAEGKNGSPNGVYEMWVDQQVGTNNVIEMFEATKRIGFQQTHNPQFIFSTSDNRFALGIGGYITQ